MSGFFLNFCWLWCVLSFDGEGKLKKKEKERKKRRAFDERFSLVFFSFRSSARRNCANSAAAADAIDDPSDVGKKMRKNK